MSAESENIVYYTTQDSIKCVEILNLTFETKHVSTTDVAKLFLGIPYQGGTLDREQTEGIVVRVDSLDCTTFVELVVAIAVSARNGDTDFSSVCRNLERIRYRNGKNCGYASRLHYISWWITDGAKSGIVQEITALMSNERQGGTLDYMSTHPDSYPLLVEHPRLINEIANHEKISNMDNTCYIPKERLSNCSTFDIREGDIIAINIPAHTIELKVSDEVLAERRAKWVCPEPKIKTGYLARYAKMVSSADRGAILE